jgi:hypothetical protein
MEDQMIMLACGCNYSKSTWKEGSVCWYCLGIENETKPRNCWDWKAYRGFRQYGDGRLRVRSHKMMMEARKAQMAQ